MTGVTLIPVLLELRALLVTFLPLYIIVELHLERKDILLLLKGMILFAFSLSNHGLIEKGVSRTILIPVRLNAWDLLR